MGWSIDNSQVAAEAAEAAEAERLLTKAEREATEVVRLETLAVKEANKTKYLPSVSTVALRNSTYPNPLNGDTVKVTGDSSMYRFQTGTGWVKTDEYNPTAIDNVTTQLADMDAQKASKTELANVLDGTPKGTYVTLAALQTAFPTGTTGVYIVTADGHIYSWSGTAWVDRGLYQAVGIAKKSIDVEKLDFYKVGTIGASVISDADFDTVGSLDSVGGIYAGNTGSKTTSVFFEIESGDYIESHNNANVNRGFVKVSFYSSQEVGSHLSQLQNDYATGKFIAPTGAKYARFSISTTNLTTFPSIKIQKGTNVIPIVLNRLGRLDGVRTENEVIYNNITVKTDGTGDFTTLNSAINAISLINDSSKRNRYNVYIHEGTYNVFTNLTSNQTERGIILPDYVYLIGVGEKGKVIIKGEHAIGEVNTNVSARSPLNINQNNGMKNLTVTAKNCRYAVHADNSNFYPDYTWEIENCDFIHYGNDVSFTWQTIIAWGSGSASGAKEYFRNCRFTGNAGYTSHNNINFADSTYQEFVNCEFIGAIRLPSVQLISMGSGVNHIAKFIGCQFTGYISMTLNGATDVEYDVIGHGNSEVAHSMPSTSLKFINFSDEINKARVTSTAVTKGKPIRDYGFQIEPQYSTGTKYTFFGGVAMNAAAIGEVCYFKHRGYIDLTNILAGTANGNYIGLVGGSLAVVADTTTAIGQIVQGNNFLKLF